MSFLTNRNSQPMNIADNEESALNLVSFICAIFTTPWEMALRPRYGTRYVPPSVLGASCLLMIVLPLLGALFQSVQSIIPFSHPAPAIGMFGFDVLAKLFFAALVLHAIRLKRLMFHLELEENSYFEGPALAFFSLVPWFRRSFFATRIVAEPLLLLLASVVLQDLFIIQQGIAIYMRIAAVALSMKGYISWYRNWQYARDVRDTQAIGPVLAKLVAGTATAEELAVFHIANFPKDVSEQVRAEATANIVRIHTPQK
jgi:hypothetical protein